MRRAIGVGVLAVFAAGCSADVTEITVDGFDEQEAPGDGASDEGVALDMGDSGPEVVAAHAYFTQFGYFENDELRAQYPRWRPVVGRAPADTAVYGEELQAAVSALQARGKLTVTGAIDAPLEP